MASQAVANRPSGEVHPLTTLKAQLENNIAQFKMALPAHISPEKFQRTILTAVQTSPQLLTCDRRSLITSCLKAATDGLLPDGREAALVPFKTRVKGPNGWADSWQVQYMPMVYGLRKKILQSGEVKDIFAQVVYRQEWEEGTFYYEEGTDRQLRHKPNLALAEISDDDIIAAYSVATFADGSMSFEVMRRVELNKVRQASQTGAVGKTDRQGNAIPPKGPWVDWYAEMAKKTVMRRHSKTLPMSGDLIDVEGNETDAVLSATTLLASAEEAEPTPSMPSRDDEHAQIEHSREVDEQLDRDAFRQFDGEVVDQETGEFTRAEPEPERAPVKSRQTRAPSAQPTEAEVAPTAAAEPSKSAEPVAADKHTGTGQLMSLDEAKREIDTAETVIDVQSRRSRLLGLVADEDGDALVVYADQRIDQLKARR